MSTRLAEIDTGLVALASSGDAGAVADIVRALDRPVYGIALRMLFNPQDAEDSETCVEGAPLADLLLLAAGSEAGPRVLFLVDRNASGLTVEPQSVASGHSLGRVQLDDVRRG